jgi:hypothetical protein
MFPNDRHSLQATGRDYCVRLPPTVHLLGRQCCFARERAARRALTFGLAAAQGGDLNRRGWRAWTVSIISALSMPLEVDGGDAEVAVVEVTLDDNQGDAFVGHLDSASVPKLVRSKAPPHAGFGRSPTQISPRCRVRPMPSTCRSGDDAEQRPDGSSKRVSGHGCSCSQPQRPCRLSRRRPSLP